MGITALRQFSEEIKDLFLEGKIRTPIHLSGGNEDSLIAIFKRIRPQDWVFSTYRSHYHALLKGIPDVKERILNGESMRIFSKKYKFFTSAIVSGGVPIAVGTALAIQRKGLDEKVYVFVGDMASETGVFHECVKYSIQNKLPIEFYIEDNGYSVLTPTHEIWGEWLQPECKRYSYERIYPHQGVGIRVEFR